MLSLRLALVSQSCVRDRLRKQLLVAFYFTVTDAITHADARRAVIVRRHSCRRSLAGEWCLHA
jgi:hypothetical protein